MIVSSFDWDDELPPETGEEVYRALRRALQRKQGFGLFFVQCSKGQGEEIIADLRQDLPQQRIQELHLLGEVTTLYDQIATIWQQQPFDVLVLDGLEASLYAYEDVKRLSGWGSGEIYNYSWKGVPKILNHLNQQREHLRNDFPARFVFLVPPFVVDYFIQRAADFLDWRSGLFRFPRDSKEIAEESDRFLADGGYNQYLKLMPHDRVEKILTLRAMLQEMDSGSESRKCDLLFKLGLLFAAEQDYEDSLTSWEKVLDLKPDFYAAWHNRGNALSDLGRKEEAIRSYDQAVEIKPDYHAAWYARGNALSDLGRKEEAVQNYDKAVEIKPDYHRAWNHRGNALSDLGRKEEAVQNYDKAVEIKPDYHAAWYNRGLALSDLGRKEEAVQSYDKALDIKPDKRKVWNHRGVALFDLGRKEEAVQSYDKALDTNPGDHAAWCARGWALFALGRKEEAVQNYDQALQIQPNFAPAYYIKACCYGLQEKIDLAIETLQQAITLNFKYQEMAKTDSAFDRIRNDDRFRALIGE
jgi:tetratricopeptide (TPR) repeat protein